MGFRGPLVAFAFALFATLAGGPDALGAEKYFYLFGGGGEPKGDKTIFDIEVKALGSNLDEGQWKGQVAYDGDHEKSKQIVKRQLDRLESLGTFDKKAFEGTVQELSRKIREGKITSEDKIILSIMTHGQAKLEKETSHSVVLATKSEEVSLDLLKPLLEAAKARKVKLALLDLSCRSGNSQALADGHACIISATGSDQLAYYSTSDASSRGSTFFTRRFIRGLKPGRNLEEVFLDARAEGGVPDFPMISTPEARYVQTKLYDLLAPLLMSDNEDFGTRQFRDHYNPAFLKEQRCRLENDYQDLRNLLQQLQAAKAGPVDTSELIEAIDKYRRFQREYEEAVAQLGPVGQEIERILAQDHPAKAELLKTVDWGTLLRSDYERSTKSYELALEKPGMEPKLAEAFRKSVALHRELGQIQKDVKAKLSMDSRKRLARLKKANSVTYESYELAAKVARAARSVYDRLYRQQLNPAVTNPCREFVL